VNPIDLSAVLGSARQQNHFESTGRFTAIENHKKG
jgi:hypothetical protein